MNIYRLVIILMPFLLGSCKTMYLPNMQNVPMFRDEGELQLTVAFQNAQLAYSLTDQVGVIANVFNRSGKIPHLDDGNTYNYMSDSYGFDFGAGFFSRGDSVNKMELFGGYGFGKASLDYGYDAPISSGFADRGGSSHYHKIFIQPTLITRHKNVDFGFSVRVSFHNFYDFKDKLGESMDDTEPIFLEPALTFSKRVSAFSFRGQLQFSLAGGDAGDGFYEYDPYKSNILLNVGVTADLVKLFARDFD